jgi:hypothetical protein
MVLRPDDAGAPAQLALELMGKPECGPVPVQRFAPVLPGRLCKGGIRQHRNIGSLLVHVALVNEFSCLRLSVINRQNGVGNPAVSARRGWEVTVVQVSEA